MIAVLPLPNRSYTTPRRGEMSFQLTESVFGNVTLRFGTHRAGPRWFSGKYPDR